MSAGVGTVWRMATIERYPRPGTSFADLIAADRQPSDQGRHVWISDPPHGRHAGLLVAWEHLPDAWWGRVVMVDDHGDAVEMMIRSDRLRPT